MSRPIKLFCYKLGRELHLDVDIVASWPLPKLYEYMAFYRTEQDDWQKGYKEDQMTPEERQDMIFKMLGGQ